MPHARIAANSKTNGPAAPSRTCSAVHAEAGSSLAISTTVRAASRRGALGLRPRPEYSGMLPAGSAVQNTHVLGTSSTYRCPRSSSLSRRWPARPYSESPTTQSSSTCPPPRGFRLVKKVPRPAVLRAPPHPVELDLPEPRAVPAHPGRVLRLGLEGHAVGDGARPPPLLCLRSRRAPRLGQEEPMVEQD